MSGIIAIILKALLVAWSGSLFAQNPTNGTFTSIHVNAGYVTRPGVSPINCPRFFKMNDSTEFHLFPPTLYFDSLFNNVSAIAPSNILCN